MKKKTQDIGLDHMPSRLCMLVQKKKKNIDAACLCCGNSADTSTGGTGAASRKTRGTYQGSLTSVFVVIFL